MNKEYSSKENAIFAAVVGLIEEGADLNNLTVAEITRKAGIGKGTAYEYFTDKEEMIAKALLHNSEVFCRQLYAGVCKQESLSDKVDYVLIKLEQQAPKAKCILRLIQILSDNSIISKRIRSLFKEMISSKQAIGDVIKNILEDEFRDRKTPSENELDYLVYNIYSKLICWAMVLNDDKYQDKDKRDTLRGLISAGICRDIRTV